MSAFIQDGKLSIPFSFKSNSKSIYGKVIDVQTSIGIIDKGRICKTRPATYEGYNYDLVVTVELTDPSQPIEAGSLIVYTVELFN